MPTTKSIRLFLLCLALMAMTTSSHAQGTLAAGTAVSGMINQLDATISGLIDQLDDRVSARAFQLRTELVFLQDELAYSAERLVDKTFGELEQQQQIFFENSVTTVAEIESVLKTGSEEVDLLTTKGEHLLAMIPTFEEEPRVRKTSPLFVKRAGSADSVIVTVNGSFLNHGDAQLEFSDSACEIKGEKEAELIFECSRTALQGKASGKVEYVTGHLSVERETDFLGSIARFFGSEPDWKSYKIPMAIVPATLGSYSITVTHQAPRIESQKRSGKWGQTNKHCKGRQEKTTSFSPASAQWSIDINSIKIHRTCGRHGNGHRKENETVNGFQIRSWAKNKGNCVKAFGNTVSKDGRGCEMGTVSWTETRSVLTRTETILQEGQLEWGKAVSVKLPEKLEGFLVSVDQINGQHLAIIDGVPSEWFAVRRDAASTALVISPLSLEQALR